MGHTHPDAYNMISCTCFGPLDSGVDYSLTFYTVFMYLYHFFHKGWGRARSTDKIGA